MLSTTRNATVPLALIALGASLAVIALLALYAADPEPAARFVVPFLAGIVLTGCLAYLAFYLFRRHILDKWNRDRTNALATEVLALFGRKPPKTEGVKILTEMADVGKVVWSWIAAVGTLFTLFALLASVIASGMLVTTYLQIGRMDKNNELLEAQNTAAHRQHVDAQISRIITAAYELSPEARVVSQAGNTTRFGAIVNDVLSAIGGEREYGEASKEVARVYHALESAKVTDIKLVNFSNADFSHENLRGHNFSGFNLYSSSFRGAFLDDANFKGASLSSVDFREATLTGADFSDANLEGALITCARSMPDDQIEHMVGLPTVIELGSDVSVRHATQQEIDEHLMGDGCFGEGLPGAFVLVTRARLTETPEGDQLIKGAFVAPR